MSEQRDTRGQTIDHGSVSNLAPARSSTRSLQPERSAWAGPPGSEQGHPRRWTGARLVVYRHRLGRRRAPPAVVSATDLAALLEAMLASSLDAVITIDRDGRVITFNAAAERTFGYAAEDAVGRDVAELIIPPDLRERHYSAIARHLATGETTILGRRVELTGMRADRTVFPSS